MLTLSGELGKSVQHDDEDDVGEAQTEDGDGAAERKG